MEEIKLDLGYVGSSMLSLLNYAGCSMWKGYLWMLQQPQEDSPLSLQRRYKAMPVERLRCIFLHVLSAILLFRPTTTTTTTRVFSKRPPKTIMKRQTGYVYLEISNFVNSPSFPQCFVPAKPRDTSSLPNCMQNSRFIGLSAPSLVLGLRRTVFVA